MGRGISSARRAGRTTSPFQALGAGLPFGEALALPDQGPGARAPWLSDAFQCREEAFAGFDVGNAGRALPVRAQTAQFAPGAPFWPWLPARGRGDPAGRERAPYPECFRRLEATRGRAAAGSEACPIRALSALSGPETPAGQDARAKGLLGWPVSRGRAVPILRVQGVALDTGTGFTRAWRTAT